jgi:glycerol-3-phosphate acyltransferase PlsX
MKIGVDGMGGDYAPQVVIEAVNSIKGEFDIVVVGNEKALKNELKNAEIVHAEEVIEMEEEPQKAIKKKNSSIGIGIALEKEEKIDAFISAGNTGAYVMFSVLELGRIENVRRPALGVFFPGKNGYTFVLDVGANVESKVEDMVDFGIMGSMCVEGLIEKKNPTVGLLSIGEEEIKGSYFNKEIFNLMKEKLPNFYGNIEGHKILDNVVDVLVCDGFVGNVLLKFGESVVDTVWWAMKEGIKKGKIFAKLGGILLQKHIKKELGRLRYQKYGGAILLGVKGVNIICHGRSDAETIRNAIYTAEKYVKKRINKKIEENLKRRKNGKNNLF